MSSAVGDFSTSLSLIRRAQAVETGAWETVVRLYGPLIYGWGRRMGLQSQDAADLTQTVFLSVWRGLPGFTFDRPDASFRGWLRTIAQNAVRARGRRKPSEILIGERLEDVPDAALELTITGAASDPMFGTLAQRALELVRQTVDANTWDAFWQVAMEDRPVAEVAAALSITPAAVRQAKYRVLCRLRQLLSDR